MLARFIGNTYFFHIIFAIKRNNNSIVGDIHKNKLHITRFRIMVYTILHSREMKL